MPRFRGNEVEVCVVSRSLPPGPAGPQAFCSDLEAKKRAAASPAGVLGLDTCGTRGG